MVTDFQNVHRQNQIPISFLPITLYLSHICHLGGVVVSVLATGPKGCGFEHSQGNGFLMAIKIHSTPSSRMGSKAGRFHVTRFYDM
jgi:hypothetical protein